MKKLETYLLEELKQSDQKLRSLDDLQLSLIKFYFTTAFSLSTVVLGLYNFGVTTDLEKTLAWFLLFPLIALGYVTNYSLGRILIEYEHWEHTRHQVSESFIFGEIRNSYQLFNSPLKFFRTLVSWAATLTLFAFVYFVIPFSPKIGTTVVVSTVVTLIVTGILSTIVLSSLNSARKKSRDARRIADIKQIQLALELFYDSNHSYPGAQTWEELSKTLEPYFKNIPNDPNAPDKSYLYESADGSDYTLRYTLEEKGEQSVSS